MTNTAQRSKEQIIDYFQEYVFGFIYHDIERCIEARANYVVALALLSYTEYIGGLISGNLGLKIKSRQNFNEALKYFPQKYRDLDSSLEIEYVEGVKTKSEKGIYAVFRCGMIHEYFIKGVDTGVINRPDGHTDSNLIGIKVVNMMKEGQTKVFIFHTNEYFRDFKSAVDIIYKRLIVKCDPKLLDGFNASLDRVYSRRIL